MHPGNNHKPGSNRSPFQGAVLTRVSRGRKSHYGYKGGDCVKNNLNKQDIKKWAKNTVLFSSPAILAFLLAVQSGADLDFAKGAAAQAFLASSIDLLKKFRAGV